MGIDDDREASRVEDRHLMTVIASASNPRFTVSRVDIDRHGPIYRVGILTDLAAQFPDDELFFIMGGCRVRVRSRASGHSCA